MAFIAVTYTFTNGTTSDASQVNSNFTDLINGLSDGTKDISVSAGTFAGNLTVNGNTTIGNASGDDLTITASLASSIPIKTTNTYDIGSSTLGLRALYFGANSQTVKIQGSSSMSATWTLTLPVTAGTDGYYLKTNGSGVSSWSAFTPPTVQNFTSGSGTYTTPANVKYLIVRMVGGGAGGAESNSTGNSGAAGGNTTFGSSLLTAGGGSAGTAGSGGNGGGAGGTVTVNAPALTLHAVVGGRGCGASLSGTAGNNSGAMGGSSALGGAGGGGGGGGGAPNAATNSGSGGGSGGAGTADVSGPGGGAGGYIVAIIPTPSATYSYAVGAGGAGGTGAGGADGGAGGSGYISVTEYYQ